MPWIEEKSCTGCGICIDECPANAIFMNVQQAEINMAECIRCGVCHDVCPQEAIRHDSEKIPETIKMNVNTTKKYMERCANYFNNVNEKHKCLERVKRHFNKEKMIAEKTLEELEKIN